MTSTGLATPRFCRRCDYDLTASAGPVCPECGRAFSTDDPRSFHAYSRRTWRGRLRRWRGPIALLLLVIALWPHGWILVATQWVDPTNASVIEGKALRIGRPWWCGGYYPSIVRGSSSGAPPATQGISKYVELTVNTSRGRTVLLRRSDFSGGRLAVLGLPGADNGTPPGWQAMIEAYVRSVAAATADAQGESDDIVINAPVPPWDPAKRDR